MKKTIAVLLTILMLAGLAACVKKEDPSGETSPSSADTVTEPTSADAAPTETGEPTARPSEAPTSEEPTEAVSSETPSSAEPRPEEFVYHGIAMVLPEQIRPKIEYTDSREQL